MHEIKNYAIADKEGNRVSEWIISKGIAELIMNENLAKYPGLKIIEQSINH